MWNRNHENNDQPLDSIENFVSQAKKEVFKNAKSILPSISSLDLVTQVILFPEAEITEKCSTWINTDKKVF